MIGTFATTELERFRGSIAANLGLHFEDARLGFLGEVLRRRLDALRARVDDYLAQLETGCTSSEVAALGQELTVAETYFFRHLEQYRAFTDVALPERLRVSQLGGRRLAVASLGCATGEEPYSLAIAVRDAIVDRADAVSILGVDVNPAVLDRATRARYSAWVLRETSSEMQKRWFRPEGREFVLDERIRQGVRFEQANLNDESLDLWRPGSYDIVFCRNALMYFVPSAAQAVVGRIARSLKPGGYLFLGHAETLRALSNEFHLRHTHGTFYYQRKEHGESDAVDDLLAASQSPAGLEPMAPPDWTNGGTTWIDTIQRASDRIRSLTQSSDHVGSSAQPARTAPRASREIALALELLHEERYEDALAIVTALPNDSERDAEVLLLRAVLLTHSGKLPAAERTCERLLEINELNAEAHYLLALCRESAGDEPGSVYHDQVAVYLDPSFAMAHLHLGLLARRTQDSAAARRELEQAIALLEREDASRLLLFGGGFSRDALVALCRAELLGAKGR